MTEYVPRLQLPELLETTSVLTMYKKNEWLNIRQGRASLVSHPERERREGAPTSIPTIPNLAMEFKAASTPK